MSIIVGRMSVAILAVTLTAAQCAGKQITSSKVSVPELAVQISGADFKNARAEVLLSSGELVKSRLDRVEGSRIPLKGKKPVSICEVVSVRLTMDAASRVRRVSGTIGGAVGGLLLIGSLAVNIGFAGAETAAVVLFAASPIIGGWVGSKLAAKNQHHVFYVTRKATDPDCSTTPGAPPVPE